MAVSVGTGPGTDGSQVRSGKFLRRSSISATEKG